MLVVRTGTSWFRWRWAASDGASLGGTSWSDADTRTTQHPFTQHREGKEHRGREHQLDLGAIHQILDQPTVVADIVTTPASPRLTRSHLIVGPGDA